MVTHFTMLSIIQLQGCDVSVTTVSKTCLHTHLHVSGHAYIYMYVYKST